jgi:hypothetical protein
MHIYLAETRGAFSMATELSKIVVSWNANKERFHYPKVYDRIILLQLLWKGKAIPVRGRGGPQGCETLRLPHFIENQLTDGGEVVSLTRLLHFTPGKISWYSFLLEAELT